jgi:hypothetical protein
MTRKPDGVGRGRAIGIPVIGFLVIAVSLLPACPAGAETARLKIIQTLGKRTYRYAETIIRTADGFRATIESEEGSVDTVRLDRDWATLEWTHKESGGSEIAAVREESAVSVQGKFKKLPINVRIDMGELPWFEFQEISYASLAARGNVGTECWVIDRRLLIAAKAYAEPKGAETISIAGRTVEALCFDLTMSGIPASIFVSRLWIRRGDGRFLRLESPSFLGYPASVLELAAESIEK